MVRLLTSQRDSDRLFDRWASLLIKAGTRTKGGWVIDGTGLTFSNYGDGLAGTIGNSVMLGVDAGLGTGVVKIVRPDVTQQDRGKLTAIGQDENGRHFLLRQGRLQQNGLSKAIVDEFSVLSGLARVLQTAGSGTPRDWYVVAALSDTDDRIVEQTVAFANACALARSRAGGASPQVRPEETYRLGVDEKGGIRRVVVPGGEREVLALQGYVSEALKEILGDRMSKPGRHGYEADAMIEGAGLLIEIKTGVGAQDIHAAVGQLALYPSLLGLPEGLEPILLVPDNPRIHPAMTAALAAKGIGVHFYSITLSGPKPQIKFRPEFVDRCAKDSGS